MAYLKISKLDMNRTPVLVYRIYNMESFSHNLRTPISPLPLPEEGADENILVKVEGNSATMSIVYKIKQETPVENRLPIFSGGEIDIPDTFTIFQQWNIIQDQFVGISIDDAYRFEFVEVENSVEVSRIEWEGFITDFQVRTGGDSPTVLTASIDFIQGNVITTYELDGASPPLNVEVSTAGGSATVRWDPPTDRGTGNPSIIRYRVQYRIPGDPWETEETTSNQSQLIINGLTIGSVYRFRVAAINSNQQAGSYSPEVQAVIT